MLAVRGERGCVMGRFDNVLQNYEAELAGFVIEELHH